MSTGIRRLAGLLCFVLMFTAVAAQRLKVDPDQKYLLLATKRTTTMQKELDEAAGLGYRVVAGSPTSGNEIALFLEKQEADQERYQYRLLATRRTGTMERELNQMGAQGFRLLPFTMMAKDGLAGEEIVLITELVPREPSRYVYRLLATTLTRTLQKEVSEARQEGFELVGMVSRDEHIVIMEQQVPR